MLQHLSIPFLHILAHCLHIIVACLYKFVIQTNIFSLQGLIFFFQSENSDDNLCIPINCLIVFWLSYKTTEFF